VSRPRQAPLSALALAALLASSTPGQEDPEVRAILAQAEQGDYEGAQERFAALLSDTSTDSVERYAACAQFLLRSTAQFQEALRVIDCGLERYPGAHLLRFWRGDALWSLGDPAAAALEYEAVLDGNDRSNLAPLASERLAGLAPIFAERQRATELEHRALWAVAAGLLLLASSTWWLARRLRSG
jgi:predicted Zn-dependent protease